MLASVAHLGLTSGVINPSGKGCNNATECAASEFCYKVGVDPGLLSNDLGKLTSLNYTVSVIKSKLSGEGSKVGVCGPKKTSTENCDPTLANLFDGSGAIAAWATDQNGAASLSNVCSDGYYCSVTSIDATTGAGAAACHKLPAYHDACAVVDLFTAQAGAWTTSLKPFCGHGLKCSPNDTTSAAGACDSKNQNTSATCGTCVVPACTASADCPSDNNVCYKVNIDKSLTTSKVTSFNYTTTGITTPGALSTGATGICGPAANTNPNQSCEPKAPILLGTTEDVLTGVCQPTEYCAVNVAGKTGTCTKLPQNGDPCAAPDNFKTVGHVYQPSIDPICAAHTVCTVGAKDCQPVQNAFCGTCTSTTTTTQASSTQASSTTNTSGATTTSIAASFVMMLMTFIL